jgi:hypothetical protein
MRVMATPNLQETRFNLKRLSVLGLGGLCLLLATIWGTFLDLDHETKQREELFKELRVICDPKFDHSAPNQLQSVAQFKVKLGDNLYHHGIHILRDAGIAFVISIIVISLLERTNRQLVERDFEVRLARVSTRTVGAVFGNDHPQAVFETARDSITSYGKTLSWS